MTLGTMATDVEQRIDFDALRKFRLARAREQMENMTLVLWSALITITFAISPIQIFTSGPAANISAGVCCRVMENRSYLKWAQRRSSSVNYVPG